MKIDSLMWLLVVVFMIHDFEEVILMIPWLRASQGELQARFPALARRMLPQYEGLTSAGYALAVGEEFVVLAGLTLLAVERSLYSFWMGMLLAFFLHLLLHIATTLIYGKYVPVVITSLLACGYCGYALAVFLPSGLVDWGPAILWCLVSLVVIAANLALAIRLGVRFDAWAARRYGRQG